MLYLRTATNIGFGRLGQAQAREVKRVVSAFALAITLIVAILESPMVTADGLILLTDGESQQFNLLDEEVSSLPSFYGSIKLRGNSGGPEILLIAPELGEEKIKNRPLVTGQSPLSLHVEFKQTAKPVDMDSLTIKVVKFGFTKDLTPLLRDHIIGTSVRATGLEVRQGKYRVAVRVADTEGVQSRAEYILQVVR
jgi:hypothetical protein